MTDDELKAIVKLVVSELAVAGAGAVAAAQLPTFDISKVLKCCEDKCPCNSKNTCPLDSSGCSCNSKCGCHEKTPFQDELDIVAKLARLPQNAIKTVLDAAPVIAGLRSGEPPDAKT
jgi:hypothetical protein